MRCCWEGSVSEGGRGKNVGAVAGVLGLLAVVFLKFKVYIFAAFKALPLLKLGWLLKGSASLFLSLGLYMTLYGWKYAVTLILLIYVHEMGHFVWMKAKGLQPKAPVFVPLVGAYVAMTHLPKDMATHAWVAYAGPLVGGLAAAVMYAVGMASGNTYLIAAANTGFIINLLQLVPVRPFDGGFIAGAISRWLYVPGIILLVAAALVLHSVLLTIVAVVGVFMLISMLRGKGESDMTLATLPDRLVIAAAYFALALLLGWFYHASEVDLIHLHGQGALRS